MSEDDTQPQITDPVAVETDLPVKKTGLFSSPWLRYGGLSLLMLGGGSLFGHYTADRYILRPPDTTALQSEFAELKSANSALKAQISRLEGEIKTLPKPQAQSKPQDLSGIIARLNKLEDRPEPEPIEVIDPDLVSRLEALKADGSDVLDLTDILSRLDRLESREVPDMEPLDMSGIISRLEALEAKPEFLDEIAAPSIGPDTVIIPGVQTAIPAFPKAALLDALPKEKDKSWLEKQISVRGPDDPSLLIEKIVDNVSDENWAAAAYNYDRLPETVRAVGQDWRDAVQARL